MTDVTNANESAGLSAADERVLRELAERARAGGLKLTGEGGLLGRLTKMVVEGALEGEMDDHLGYSKHAPEGRDGGNSRNGHRAKSVLTEGGPVEISVPRDRDSSFEPKIVAKRQRRLSGVEDMVISLSAKGLTHGEIAAHLAEVYGARSPSSRSASMSQAARRSLLFVLGPVFELHVRFNSGGWHRVLPGVPGAAPASTWPGCVSSRVVGTVRAGQLGAGRTQSRFQQVMKASFQGQSGLILRILLRAWLTSRAGRCQIR